MKFSISFANGYRRCQQNFCIDFVANICYHLGVRKLDFFGGTMKTLLIDFDDTIISSFELPLMNQFLQTRYIEADFSNYIQEKLPKDKADAFYDYLSSHDIYADSNVHFFENAVDVLKELNKKYKLFLCSDYTFWERPWASDHFFLCKFNALKRNLNFISPLQHVFLKEKSLLCADIMIDDRPENFGENIKQKLLFTSYHNERLSDDELRKKGMVRVNNWTEIAQLLLK